MTFRRYIIKRVATAFLALYIALTVIFLILRVLSPVKDPTILISDPNFPEWRKEELRHMWGLDRPLYEQYFVYMYNLITWQYGISFETPPKHIAPEMGWRLVNTLSLLATSTLLSIIMGIVLGVFAASRRGKKTDVLVTSIGLFSWGTPQFFIQMVFILFFSYYLRIFPSVGVVDVGRYDSFLALFLNVAWHAVLPIITLTISGLGFWVIYTRNLMVDILTQDYIMTAYAKGVKGRTVLFSHAFRSIIPQVATVIVNHFPSILSGSVVTEMLFSWPGIGQWYLDALFSGNQPVTWAITYNYAFLVVMGFLLMDILYGFLDPRIRVGVRR
jgi:peptide/nickel transport system permease protein